MIEVNNTLTQTTIPQDYHTFGMLMPGRQFSLGSYRFGYQGSEKDNEVTGIGQSHFTTFFREGDTRLGRWWGTDPKTKLTPWESPFMFMGGNPVLGNDLLGDKVKFTKDKDVSNKEFKDAKREVNLLRRNSDSYNSMFKDLKGDKETYTFKVQKSNDNATYDPETRTINLSRELSKENLQEGVDASNLILNRMVITAHETGHAWRHLHKLDPAMPTKLNREDFSSSKEFFSASNNRLVEVADARKISERGAMAIQYIVSGELNRSGYSLQPDGKSYNFAGFERDGVGIKGGSIKINLAEEVKLFNQSVNIHKFHNVEPIR